jgi:hypothetical protein
MFAAIDHALRPGGLVLFGEVHGTHEAPAFVAAAAAHAARHGQVLVALELPADLQPAVDAFVLTEDRTALDPAHPFWATRDGRAGEALVTLLIALARLRARVLCFDNSATSAEERDAGMARTITAAITRDAATLVSCGNLHAETRPPWMGAHLRACFRDLISLDIAYDGGAAFVTTADGTGISSCGTTTGDTRRGVELHAMRDEHGFDGVYHVGPLTPSLPIRL